MRKNRVTGKSLGQTLARDFKMNKWKYIIMLPVIVYFVLFAYKPMYGLLIAFQDYTPFKGMSGSNWVGFKHFINFFHDYYFIRVLRNTVVISFLTILFGFPAPILFALLLNEIHNSAFKRVVQTLTYLPHFISMVIVCGLIKQFCLSTGLVNSIITAVGGVASNLLENKGLFYPIYIISDIWQTMGWGSIIYLAAIAGVDQEQYESAKIDGAGRFQKMFYITLPSIMPTITVLFIMRMGQVLNVGYEKILLLYNPKTYEVADVISTYVYRMGLQEAQWSFSTAVGLFNSVVNVLFLCLTNYLCKKTDNGGLF